jgi:heterodisulfide reductase subunit C
MSMFGFKLSKSSAIDMDKADTALFNELCRIEPDAARCMACGSCSATCMAGEFSGMSMRKVLLSLQRGRIGDVERMMQACMLCGKCMMVCPRGINTRHLILGISRIYRKEGEV